MAHTLTPEPGALSRKAKHLMPTDTQQQDTGLQHAFAPTTTQALPIATNPPATPQEEQIFRLRIQLDLQRERALFFKVMLVLQTVVALMLLREWALRLLA